MQEIFGTCDILHLVILKKEEYEKKSVKACLMPRDVSNLLTLFIAHKSYPDVLLFGKIINDFL